LLSEVMMAASSVTGVGHGDSHGLQKHHLHSGCGCCSSDSPDPKPVIKKKTFCHVKNSESCKSIVSQESSVLKEKICL